MMENSRLFGFFFLFHLFLQIQYQQLQIVMNLAMLRNQITLAIVELSRTTKTKRRTHRMWMRPRSSSWYEQILLKGPDSLWILHFRLPRHEIENLADALKDELAPADICVREPIPLLKRVCIAVFKLASCAEYRVVAEKFSVSVTTVHRCLSTFCHSMTNISNLYIQFPTQDEAIAIAERLERQHGYIQAFGALDGSHIAITPVAEGLADYLNRKMYASLVLQGLVDDKYMFRDISCKCPGSMHDSNVLANSSLFTRLQTGMPVRDRIINGVAVPLHVLGDPAFPLTRGIMKGYTGLWLQAL